MSINSYTDLIGHVGHNIAVAAYDTNGEPLRPSQAGRTTNVTIECETCSEVLADYPAVVSFNDSSSDCNAEIV